MSENLKTNAITNYDAAQIIQPTSGEGGPGRRNIQQDQVAATTSSAQWSTYRMARFPTNAKVKRVLAYATGVDNSATPAGILDWNVAFSDSTTDGTPVVLQGTIPSNKKDGTSFAFVANTGYSTAYLSSGTGNILFGQTSAAASGALLWKDITFNGTSNIYAMANAMDDMWNVLGFVNNAGTAQDPGGKFDILAVVSTAMASAHAGVIGCEVDFCN